MKKQYVAIAGLCICVFAAGILMAGFGKKETGNEDLYGGIIAGLGDDTQFSLCDIGEKNNVLFTADMTYDDGNGHNAAMYSDVYYNNGKEAYPLGRITGMGMAYPVSYGKQCIYAASAHGLTVYTFDKKIPGWRMAAYAESFDEDGNASYHYTKEENTNEISKKEYEAAWEGYKKSTVVNFGHGASDNPW